MFVWQKIDMTVPSKDIELTEIEQKTILKEAKSTHEKLDFADEQLGYIEELKVIMPEKDSTTKNINQNKTDNLKTKITTSPTGMWGRVREKLISVYGEVTDRHWFSKLEAIEDIEKGEIKLKSPNNFIKDWINQNYFDVIENIVSKERSKVEFCC